MTAVDFGRNVEKITAVADAVPEVNVILTAGYNRPYYMGRWGYAVAEANMIHDTVRDLMVGIDGTSIKAGIIKCGTEYNNFGDIGRKLVRVAAAAYRETGRPIITHTTAGTMGYEQATYLIELGVPAHQVALSHMDRNPDLSEHQRIARVGTYLGSDCFGKAKYGPETRRLALIRDMFNAGLGNRVLIGNDLGRPSYWRAYGGGPGLDYVLASLRPRMRDEGFTEAELTLLLVENPRRFFTGEP
jgi:phosphotriesterase-related protein